MNRPPETSLPDATDHSADANCLHLADILSGVDGIAFQVNLLALNAAVEAARSSEPDCGAFVAAEVRRLARRSAEAAQHVQSLIGDRVGGSSDLERHAVQTMDDILASIRRVSEIVTGLGSATCAPVGTLGTQSAPAAERLRVQAHRMVQAVDRCARRPGSAA